MKTPLLPAALLLILFPLASGAQTNPAEGDIAQAKVLLGELTGDVQKDAAVLRLTGLDHASQILSALVSSGMSTTASADEWVDLHRALDGLIDLEVLRGALFKAAIHAGSNRNFYRNHEQDYEAALRSSYRARDLQQKSGATETLYLAYQSIAQDLLSLGRVDQALESYRHARQLLSDPAGKPAARLSEDIVTALLARHDLVAAEKECDEVDRAAQNAPPVFQAYALLTRSRVLFGEGNYNAAIEAIIKARATAVPKEEALSLDLAANATAMSGSLDALYDLPYQEALALGRRLDRELPGMLDSVGEYARLIVNQRRRLAGDIDGLMREDAGRVEAAKSAGNLPEQIAALQSLATTYSAVNGVRQQAVLLEEALRLIRPALPSTGIPVTAALQSYFRILDALGGAYLNLGQTAAARKSFDDVVNGIATFDPATRNRLRGLFAGAVLGRTRVLEMQDEPENARDALLRILGDDSAVKNGFDRTEVLLQLARLERSLNEKPASAAQYYEQAIAGYHESHSLEQELAGRLALARYLTGKAAGGIPDARNRAEAHLLVVARALPRLNYAEGAWRLNFLRGILAEPARPEAAMEYYREAIRKLDEMRAGLTQQDQRQGLLDNEAVQELYSRLVALLTRAGRREEAWQFLERGKARSFVEMLQGRRFPSADSPPEVGELQKAEQQVAILKLQLDPGNAEFLHSAGREPAVIGAELKGRQARFVLARQQAGLNQSRTGQVLSLEPPQIGEIQKRIPPRTVLIEYGLLEGEITAFVVTPANFEQLRWPADTKALRGAVAQLRPLLADAGSAAWIPLVERLSSVLIDPVAKALPAGTDQLWIVPAAYLNYLPFSVLRLPDGRAIIDAYSTSYLPSASALLYLPDAKKAGGDLYLGALGDQSVEGLAPLPGTLRETAAIAQVYPNAHLAAGAEFTHDEARSALLHYDEVHFATHGLFDKEAPLLSALVTSPARGQPSRLSLYEITDLPLKAGLVVLSACETGLGKLLGGDEITGLTRTFLTAGANTVVSSLWKVGDESTAMLMQDFYRRLRDGEAPAHALRDAAVKVRGIYPHPFYWAPFVVTGR